MPELTDLVKRQLTQELCTTEHHSIDLSPAGIAAAVDRLKSGARLHLTEGREQTVDTTDPLLFKRVVEIVKRRRERLLHGDEDPRLKFSRDAVLQQVLAEMAADPHPVILTLDQYYHAKLISEQPQDDLSPEEDMFPYLVKILVSTIDSRVRDRYAQSAETMSLAFQNQIVEEAVNIAILEQRMSRHEFSGLNTSYEAIRDRFLIELERLQREKETTGKEFVLLAIEMDAIGLKDLNSLYQPNIVDRDIFGPLGQALQTKLRDTDFASLPSFTSQPAGDEFPIIMNLVESDQVETVAARLHTIIAEAPYPPHIDKSRIKFRIGIRVFTLEEAKTLPTNDVVAFISSFRNDSLQAAEEAKRQKINTMVWRPDLANATPEQAEDRLTRQLERDLSSFIARTQELLGDELSREAKAKLLATWEAILQSRTAKSNPESIPPTTE